MRSELRIADLKRRVPTSTRLINVKIPAHLGAAIDQYAKELGASKSEVVIALLNTGLDRAAATLASLKWPRKRG